MESCCCRCCFCCHSRRCLTTLQSCCVSHRGAFSEMVLFLVIVVPMIQQLFGCLRYCLVEPCSAPMTFCTR